MNSVDIIWRVLRVIYLSRWRHPSSDSLGMFWGWLNFHIDNVYYYLGAKCARTGIYTNTHGRSVSPTTPSLTETPVTDSLSQTELPVHIMTVETTNDAPNMIPPSRILIPSRVVSTTATPKKKKHTSRRKN